MIGHFGRFSTPPEDDECFTEETNMVDPYHHSSLNPIYGKIFEDGHFCIPKVQGKIFIY